MFILKETGEILLAGENEDLLAQYKADDMLIDTNKLTQENTVDYETSDAGYDYLETHNIDYTELYEVDGLLVLKEVCNSGEVYESFGYKLVDEEELAKYGIQLKNSTEPTFDLETEYKKICKEVDKAVVGFKGYERAQEILEFFAEQGEVDGVNQTFNRMAMERTNNTKFATDLKRELAYQVATNRVAKEAYQEEWVKELNNDEWIQNRKKEVESKSRLRIR